MWKEKWNKRIFRSLVKHKLEELDFDADYLTELFEKQNGLCYYTNMPMITDTSSKSPRRASLDRLDSNIGYRKDNVVLCIRFANLAKSNFDYETFMSFINKLKNPS